MRKKILFVLFGAFILAQFIQPDRSARPLDPAQDMLTVMQAPPNIQTLVRDACYDCHSHATTYPWYAYVTPVNFIVQNHVEEGREELNFSQWAKGGEEGDECAELVQKNEMPPGYYRFMHAHGRLSDAQRNQLVSWFTANMGGEGAGEEEEQEEH
ncbi:MAG: heme-binding domain-containing protein [Flavobacteriales bacterium]|nr:MAG: heme-binding domain-containing protein [Flavobacteriales bacterium]